MGYLKLRMRLLKPTNLCPRYCVFSNSLIVPAIVDLIVFHIGHHF